MIFVNLPFKKTTIATYSVYKRQGPCSGSDVPTSLHVMSGSPALVFLVVGFESTYIVKAGEQYEMIEYAVSADIPSILKQTGLVLP